MKGMIFKRLGQLILLLIGVSFIVFMSMHLAPGDAASMVAGPTATASDIEQIRINLGLDRPIFIQYFDYLRGIATGYFGTSFQYNRPVADILLEAFPNTIQLAIASIIVAIILGVSAGIISAVKHNTWIDRLSSLVSLIGISLPNFWLGAVLILIFAVNLGWFPVGGFTHPIWTMQGLRQITLPAITLGAASAAMISRMSRASMLEVIRADYIRTARAKGLKEKSIILVHSLRNAMIPVITVIGVNFGLLLGGSIITENVFAIRGLGSVIVEAIARRDFPVVQGAVLIVASVFVVINLLIDIIYTLVDPRISYE
ncbi:MAG: ABC transporter permease [Streptococcaceae bacterium]|jgi:peptide/nickel transport system permease protein|nr:ABC transporter permease [Streptococcaceae bacterium]